MALFNLGQGSFVPEASTVTFDSFELGAENPVATFDLPDLGTVEVSFGTSFVGQSSAPLTDGVFTLSDSDPEGPLALDSDADPVFTAEDGSADTNPVLSGTPTFNGPISVLFSEPVAAVGLTGGFFDAVESTSIEAFDTDGNSLGLVRNTQTGFEFFGLATDTEANDIAGISFYITDDEPAGFGIDNLTFGTTEEVAATVAIQPDQAVLAEGNEGTTEFTFTVERNGSLAGETTVDYEITGVGDNPADENDFVDGAFPSGTVSFAADEAEKTITVEVVGDTEVEADERFEVTLSNVNNGAIGLPRASSTIQNDDQDDDADAAPSLEPNDTLEQATDTNLSFNNPGEFTFSGEVGNNPNVDAGLDVDIYEFDLAARDRATIDIDAEVNDSNLDSVVQIFNEAGERVAANDDHFAESTLDSFLEYTPVFSGTYYAVVSGFGNRQYDVLNEGSGTSGSTGEYDITIDVAGVPVGPDEPNDSFDTALFTSLTSDNPGEFNFSSTIGDNPNLQAQGLDVDLLEVQLNAGDQLTATIDTIDVEEAIGDAALRVFDSNGNELTAERASEENLNNGGSSLEFVADTSGSYFVGASGLDNLDYDPANAGSGDVGATGDYNLALEVANPEESNEPNDTIPNAIPAGETINGEGEFIGSGFIGDNSELENPNLDVDLYSVSLLQGEGLNIDVDTANSSNLDLVLRVFNSNGGEVAFNKNGTAGGELESNDPFLNFSAPFSGQYYIGVSDAANDFYAPFVAETGLEAGNTGAYNIAIKSTSFEPETFEDPTNDTLDTAVSLDLEQEGMATAEGSIGDHPDFITVPGLDVDLYKVALEENEEIAIEVAATVIDSSLDASLRLFNSDGEEIAANNDFNDLDPFIQVAAPEAGDYYIGVSGHANNGYDPNEAGTGNDPFASNGEYTLNVESLGIAAQPGPEEPNDTLETATATELTPDNLGNFSFTEGAIGDNTNLDDSSLDVDIFEVDLDANTVLTVDINTEGLESNLDSVVQIFDSEGSLVDVNDDENGETLDSFLEFSAEEAGTYYVGISGLGNNGEEGYDPNTAGSGISGASQGSYELEVVLENPPVEDPTNDTLETAVTTGLNRDNPGSLTESGIIGDNEELEAPGLDVDLYKVQLKLGDELAINVESAVLDSDLDSYLRVFNEQGEEVAFDDDSGEFTDSQLNFAPEANGIYYVGVSGFGNSEYEADTPGSGAAAETTGEYDLTLNLTPGTPVEVIDDELSTEEDAVLENNLLSNDSGEALEITAVNGEEIDQEITTNEGALLTVNADGTFTYDPNGQFDELENGDSATDSFTYTATDDAGQTGQATATITILGVTPEAQVDAVTDDFSTGERSVLEEENVLANDSPADGITVTAVNGETDNVDAEITTQAGALVTVDAEGNLSYDPNGQFNDLNDGETGTDSFTYTITDDNGETDQATVNLTIEGVTQFEDVRPTANNDIALTGSDSPVTIDVLNNDAANDQFGDLEISEFQETTSKGGSIALDDSGDQLVYTPDPDFSGEDSFTYTIANESGGFDEGTVDLTVNPADPNVRVELELRELDDEPGLQIGEEFLIDVRFRDLVTEDNPGEAVTAGYADIFFDSTRLQVIADEDDDDDLSQNGIIHDEDYRGFRKGTVDNVEGIADEVGGLFPGSAPGNLPEDNKVFTLQMKATGGGDASVIGTTTVGSNAGEANNSAITVLSQLADQRPNTNFGGLEVETLNPNITAMEVSTSFENLEGESIDSVNVGDEFNIVLSAEDLRSEGDKLGVFSAFADVNYDTVLADVTNIELAGDFASPVIDLQEAINDDQGLLEEVGGTNSDFTPVEPNTSQPFAKITATAKAQGEFNVTTDSGDEPTSLNTLFGLDNDVTSGTDYFGASLNIDIAPPEAADDAVTTNEDTVLDSNLLNNDEGIELTVTAVNDNEEEIGEAIETEAGALVTVNADGTFSYDPNGQFDQLSVDESETDSFTYTVTDRADQTAQATVTVTIEGVGEPADAIDDSFTLDEGATLDSVDVLENDSGVSPLTVTTVNDSAENVGTEITTEKGALVTLTEDGNLTYDTNGAFEALNQGETDSDSFTYTITDDDGNTDQATVNLTINGLGTPDLEVTSFDAATDHVLGGETTVNFTVANQGEASTPGFQVEILYYTANNTEELNNQEGEVVKTVAFDELGGGEETTESSEVSLPIETLLEEALADDPSVFGEELPEAGVFESNNIDHLGIRIVNSDSTGEDEEAFANNGVDGTKGVNVDDIAYFPWDFLNNDADGVVQGGEDDLIPDGEVTQVDANAVFGNIGRLINENVTEDPRNGLDLDRIDFDLDSAISPVDAVRVVNRLGYQINPDIFEDDENPELFDQFHNEAEVA